jgi:hypothetical protein
VNVAGLFYFRRPIPSCYPTRRHRLRQDFLLAVPGDQTHESGGAVSREMFLSG